MSRRPVTGVVVLLYWLLVVAGLEGLTIVRADAGGSAGGGERELVALWVGTVAGVALGQLVAWLRVRAWVLVAFSMMAFWLVPALFIVGWELFGGDTTTFVLAFVPATVCAYLSLSERGALVAFWYPAVLWMLVILDRPGGAAFDARGALPFVVGLGALFVAFLRARETRRRRAGRG